MYLSEYMLYRVEGKQVSSYPGASGDAVFNCLGLQFLCVLFWAAFWALHMRRDTFQR